MQPTAPPPFALSVPSGSLAATVRALPEKSNQASAAFHDAAIAILRVSRARGRVECDALGLVFEENISDDRRLLILDLLGTAGTPEAQSVMRRLLMLPVARRDSRTFASFVQRLGFVERPEVETLQFLMSVYAESRHEAHEVRAACAYTLGAAAGRAHVWGLCEPAIVAANVLRRDLLAATTATEKCALVTALGNAGLDTDVISIVGFVEDPDVHVRSAAALGLRKMHTYESKSALLSILSGGDHIVAESALSALFGQSLDAEELIRLAQLVLAGRTVLNLDSRILRLMVTQKLGAMGSVECPVVEEAIHLLLTRVEEQRTYNPDEKACDGQTTQVNESGAYVKFSAAPQPTTPVVALPALDKTIRHLPYSAGYRVVNGHVVSSTDPDPDPVCDAPDTRDVWDTVDDAKLAAMGFDASFNTYPPTVPEPVRRITPMATRPAKHGSASDALRACFNEVASSEKSANRNEKATTAKLIPNVATPSVAVSESKSNKSNSKTDNMKTLPTPNVNANVRSCSAFSVACPVVPLLRLA